MKLTSSCVVLWKSKQVLLEWWNPRQLHIRPLHSTAVTLWCGVLFEIIGRMMGVRLCLSAVIVISWCCKISFFLNYGCSTWIWTLCDSNRMAHGTHGKNMHGFVVTDLSIEINLSLWWHPLAVPVSGSNICPFLLMRVHQAISFPNTTWHRLGIEGPIRVAITTNPGDTWRGVLDSFQCHLEECVT